MATRPTAEEWTQRQREVLDLPAEGRTNLEIATALGVSLDGAKWHVGEVLSKLGVGSREEAGRWWAAERSSRRPLRGLLTAPIAIGAGLAAAGAAAVVTAIVVVLGTMGTSSADAPALRTGADGVAAATSSPPPTATPEPAIEPTVPSDLWVRYFPFRPIGPNVEIVTVRAGEASFSVGMFEAWWGRCHLDRDASRDAVRQECASSSTGFVGLCLYISPTHYTYSNDRRRVPREEDGSSCAGPVNPETLASGVIGNVTYSRPAPIHGVTDDARAVAAIVELRDGSTMLAPLVEPRAALDLGPLRFWLAAVPKIEDVLSVRLVDDDGNVLAEQSLFD